MNEHDIARIEEATGCALPIGYREFLLFFPAELNALLRLVRRDARSLFTDTTTIVRWNKFFRSPDYEYENSYGEMCTFPPYHIVIGANGGGDFFHLNAKHKRSRVLIWCHDDGEIRMHSKDLAAFIRGIFISTADLALSRLNLS